MNSILMKAILAMDSYNRGYAPGIKFGNQPENSDDAAGLKIGNATIYDSRGDTAAQAASFYGIAYKLSNGETVISYRGTDSLSADTLYGYGVGLGSPEGMQASLAFQFYNSVATALSNGVPVDPHASTVNISLTGHSLGGGLAGLVGAVYHKSGALFDNMAFESAASATYALTWNPAALGYNPALRQTVYGSAAPWTPKISAADTSALQTYFVDGEFLGWNRLSQQTPQRGLTLGPGVNLPDYTGVDEHSMATLAIGLYADTALGGIKDWEKSAKYFWPVMYDDAFAAGFGSFATAQGTMLTNREYSAIVRTAIAYSAIDEGTRVFGDTGIKALYNDANDLGKALAATGASANLAVYGADISKAFVQFAGTLALNQVLQSAVPGAVNGALTVSSTALSVDFSDALWTAAGGGAMPNMAARADLAGHVYREIGESAVRSAAQTLWGDSTTNVIERAVFAAQNAGASSIAAPASSGKTVLFVGGGGADTVTGSSGNELIYAGSGNDTIIASKGIDLIYGGHGRDVLDLSGTGQAVTISADNLYASADNAYKGTFGGVEKIILGAGADKIARFFYGTTIDAGAGADEAVLNSSRFYAGRTRVSGDSSDAFLNVEKFMIENNGTAVYITGLGHSYVFTNGSDAWPRFDYTDYAAKLNFSSSGGTVTVTEAGNPGAGTDTITGTGRAMIIGSGKGDVFSGSGTFWLGKGDDIVNAGAAGATLYYTGGNDVVNNSRYVWLNFLPTVNPSAVHSAEVNVRNVSINGHLKSYNYDLRVTVDGTAGSILLKDNYKQVYSPNNIFGDGDDQVQAGYGPTILLPAGQTNVATPFNDVLTGVYGVDGGAGDDILTGLSSGSYLFGGPGRDTLYGAESAIDYLYGGSGDDRIFGGGDYGSLFSYDTLSGGDGADILMGEGGRDIIHGGAGDDVLVGGAGLDYLFGDEGADIFCILKGAENDIIYDFEDGVDKIDLSQLAGISGFSSLTFIENASPDYLFITGETPESTLPFTQIASATDNGVKILLYGIAASQLDAGDFIFPGSGPKRFDERPQVMADTATVLRDGSVTIDVLGNDADPEGGTLTLLSVSAPQHGSVVINANQTITYTPAAAYEGQDFLEYVVADSSGLRSAGAAVITIIPGLDGGPGNDFLNGTAGDDVIRGFAGDDRINGHVGNDALYGGAGSDEMWGGAGDDTYVFAAGESLRASPDEIHEITGEGIDAIRLSGVLPQNVYIWSDSWTTGVYHIRYSATDEILVQSWRREGSGLSGEAGFGVERILFDNGTLWDFSAGYVFTDTDEGHNLVGSSFADTLDGRGGDDSISGGGGDDVLKGGAGNNGLYGAAGNDTYILGGVSTNYIDDTQGANALVLTDKTAAQIFKYGSGNYLNLYDSTNSFSVTIPDYRSFSSITFSNGQTMTMAQFLGGSPVYKATAGNDNIDASAATAAVTLSLLAGNDVFRGGAFNDNIKGDGGNDVIDGGGGNDTLNGGAGTDTLSYASAAGGVSVNLSLTAAQNTLGAGTDTVSAFENLTGSAFNDTLTGSSGANVIDGGAGDDVIQGLGGNDTLIGGAGVDTLSYAAATAAIKVSLAVTAAQATGGAGSDKVSGFENLIGGAGADTLTGDAGNNIIEGRNGADTIKGAAGDDVIKGGAGADKLYGEAGNDILWGEAGNDALYGGAGADTFKFTPGGGIDTIKDFKLSEGDRLDIHDILQGYDPVSKAITDYIQITTSGANSIVKIDANGLTGGVSWTQIATIEGVTGLTDELALKNAGTIVV